MLPRTPQKVTDKFPDIRPKNQNPASLATKKVRGEPETPLAFWPQSVLSNASEWAAQHA
jgi:hypothetical protein